MENNEQPVQNDPNAGTGQGELENAPESKETPLDSELVVSLLEEGDKALAKAEKKIISLKRELKTVDAGDEEELDDRINRVVEEKLSYAKLAEKDSDIEEIQALRKKNSELIESLKAKKTISNTSSGTNQDKQRPEEDLTKGYSSADLVLLKRVAERKGLSLQEYLKSKK